MYGRLLQRSSTVRPVYHAQTWQQQQVYRRHFTAKRPGLGVRATQSTASKCTLMLKALKFITVTVTLGGISTFAYDVYSYNNPPVQLPPDPKKRNLVVLGTGWGSTAFLKEIDTSKYNVMVISPRNYFLFTPLLPSCVTGILQTRSIIEPIRSILRQKSTGATYYEATATKIDCEKRLVHITSVPNGSSGDEHDPIEFDYLVHAVGSQTATFGVFSQYIKLDQEIRLLTSRLLKGIEGVSEHACFMKEAEDAQKLRKLIMSRVEEASLKGQSQENIDRLLHIVVVGGGPTGVEVAAELQDFFKQDLQKLIPELKGKPKVTLIEALPAILPMFPKQLIEYAESTMQAESIQLLKNTLVRSVTKTDLEVESNQAGGKKESQKIPYGLLVWAGGNSQRSLMRDLMTQLPEQASSRRGVLVDDFLKVKGTENIWALGDCTATSNAPTAQVASQQGAYLANCFNARGNIEEREQSQQLVENDEQLSRSERIPVFTYNHKGSLAYIGNERAIADLSLWQKSFPIAGASTLFIWRAAYIDMCISIRNQLFIVGDWTRAQFFGRDSGNL